MPKDLTVILQDRPGELARLGQASGEAGINIQGMCAFTGEGRGGPGTLGELARSLGEVSVNIELAYTTFGGVKLVIVTDDIDNARAALA